jgi:hypothetical protein
MATDLDDARRRRAQGFQLIGIGSDTGLLLRSGLEALRALGRPGPSPFTAADGSRSSG